MVNSDILQDFDMKNLLSHLDRRFGHEILKFDR